MDLKKIFGSICITSTAVLWSASSLAGFHPNYVGPQACTECHENEGKAWQQTHHFSTFKELHKMAEAKDISEKMGVKRIKKEETCAQCHYTGEKVGDPTAGITCESCHGMAKDWIKIHNDYGGKTVKKEQETEAHKKERWAKAEKAGLIRPYNIYNVARNCFQCHTVPNEKLVEVGGHKAGSDFELVSWSQGEIRHNYLRSEGKGNRPASPERRRILYVAGRVLDLEYGLRGVAEVTQKNGYAVKMAQRVQRALGHVKAIQTALKDPAIDKIAQAGDQAKLKPNNKAELLKAAEDISATAQKLIAANDGSKWTAVDGLIPKETKGTASE